MTISSTNTPFFYEKEPASEFISEKPKAASAYEEIVSLAKERIRHITDDLTPRLNEVEKELTELSETLKGIAQSVFEIRNADTSFFTRVKSLEGRIEKMLSPSEEYQNLQTQNKREFYSLVATIAAVAVIIIGVVIAAVILL